MTRNRRLSAAGEQFEGQVEALANLLRRENRGPSRRKLQREREAVQAPADLDDRLHVLVRHRKARIRRLYSIGEECDRTIFHRLIRSGNALRGHGERRNSIDPLARNAENFTARDQERDRGTLAQQRAGDAASLENQVLAVIENDQKLFLRQIREQRLEQRSLRRLRYAQRGRQRVGYERGVADRCELDKPHAVGEAIE